MSAFLQTIELYKQAGYEIKTSLNPMHFSHNQEFIRDFGTYFPFTFFIEKDKHIELRTGGG